MVLAHAKNDKNLHLNFLSRLLNVLTTDRYKIASLDTGVSLVEILKTSDEAEIGICVEVDSKKTDSIRNRTIFSQLVQKVKEIVSQSLRT